MSEYTSKVEVWECDFCGSLHDHPSLAEKCAVKCRWYRLTAEIAREKETHPKLERPEKLEKLQEELDGLTDTNQEEYQ